MREVQAHRPRCSKPFQSLLLPPRSSSFLLPLLPITLPSYDPTAFHLRAIANGDESASRILADVPLVWLWCCGRLPGRVSL